MSIADLFNKTWNIDSNLIFSFLSTPEEKRRIITSALQKIVLRFCNDQIRAEAIRLPPQPHQKPCQENLEIMISVPVIRRFENRDDAECVCVCVCGQMMSGMQIQPIPLITNCLAGRPAQQGRDVAVSGHGSKTFKRLQIFYLLSLMVYISM